MTTAPTHGAPNRYQQAGAGRAMALYVLDAGVLLQGTEPPPGRHWTTPEVEDEISPGGRDARRFAFWRERGLEIRSAQPDARAEVEAAAAKAGNLGRLSGADRSVLALALEAEAILLSDDNTVLDVARRLGVRAEPVRDGGIRSTLDFQPRCSGCGRWFDPPGPGKECPICGSPVRDKPRR